ncbi:hypothetical protein GCM10009096_07150 [Parasphingorhabdus litoris]|uniref:IS66 family transposase n=1 Tax=Parasphingorhabdus litoris TaxID=394733 RepID=A0ABP3K2Y4_9SPHN
MQADGYPGYDQLYDKARKPGPIVEVACWAHVRRKIFDVHEAEKSVAAKEALDQIALLYAAEKQLKRAPNWMTRVAGRVDSRKQAQSFFHWAEGILGQISAKMPLALALRYAITRKDALLRFTENGQLEIDNNAAERSIRGIALGRKNYMFAGPDSGGDNAAAMYSLIETAKLNKVDPEAWLADVLRRVGEGHPVNRLDELLPWNWTDETADIPEDGIPATEGELAIVEGLRNNVLARDLPDGGWNFEQAGGRKADGNGRFYVLLSTYSGTR